MGIHTVLLTGDNEITARAIAAQAGVDEVVLDVSGAIRLSRAVIKNIHENLFWAFFYNVIGIPLAAGCYVAAFGWSLNPMFGAAAMGLSSFCAVSNALRLNFLKIHDSGRDKKVKNPVWGNLISKAGQEKAKEVDESAIKAAVEEAGYEYVGIIA